MSGREGDGKMPINQTPPSPGATEAGRRRDGRPFADGNTREDGDYRVGKNRAPEHGQFRSGDGRRRGRRPKGQRNFDRDWEDELARTVQLTRDGRALRVSAHRAQVMTAMSLAAKGRERSQELVFRKAGELTDRRRTVQSQGDDALIAEWFAQQTGHNTTPEGPMIVGDDDPAVSDDLATRFDGPDAFPQEHDDDPE